MEAVGDVGAYVALSGVGAFTLALLRFAYGAIKSQMDDKDEELERLRAEVRRLRHEAD